MSSSPAEVFSPGLCFSHKAVGFDVRVFLLLAGLPTKGNEYYPSKATDF